MFCQGLLKANITDISIHDFRELLGKCFAAIPVHYRNQVKATFAHRDVDFVNAPHLITSSTLRHILSWKFNNSGRE